MEFQHNKTGWYPVEYFQVRQGLQKCLEHFLIHEAGSDHYICTWCLYVRSSDFSVLKIKQLSSETNDLYWRDCWYGREWIIDGTHVLFNAIFP